MNKYYNSKPRYGPSNSHQSQHPQQNNPQNFDNFFNSNSSSSYSQENNTIKPKYFDQMASKKFENERTGSELDFPFGVPENEILNLTHCKGNETNVDISMINTLNLLKKNNNVKNNIISRRNSHMAINPQTQREYSTTNNQIQSSHSNQDRQIILKLKEINQMLNKLTPINEQRKFELFQKTHQILSKSKERSFSLTNGKRSSTFKYNDHASLKLLAKIRKDSSIFNADDSEESDEVTTTNKIFNNNMSYLNSTSSGGTPGLLKNRMPGNYSLPNNEASISSNYNNRSAGSAYTGHYSNNFQKSRNGNFMEYDKNSKINNDKKKIFENNRENTTSDSKNSVNYSNNERYCSNCKNYIENRYFVSHQRNCKRNFIKK